MTEKTRLLRTSENAFRKMNFADQQLRQAQSALLAMGLNDQYRNLQSTLDQLAVAKINLTERLEELGCPALEDPVSVAKPLLWPNPSG